MQEGHLPVMPAEVLETLAPSAGSLQIDATVGGGGHTERILEAAKPDGRVLGLDADQAAIDRVAVRLAGYGERLVLRQANFRQLADVAPAAGFRAVDGALFDLGLELGDALADAPAMHGLQIERLQDQHVERALQEYLGVVCHSYGCYCRIHTVACQL